MEGKVCACFACSSSMICARCSILGSSQFSPTPFKGSFSPVPCRYHESPVSSYQAFPSSFSFFSGKESESGESSKRESKFFFSSCRELPKASSAKFFPKPFLSSCGASPKSFPKPSSPSFFSRPNPSPNPSLSPPNVSFSFPKPSFPNPDPEENPDGSFLFSLSKFSFIFLFPFPKRPLKTGMFAPTLSFCGETSHPTFFFPFGAVKTFFSKTRFDSLFSPFLRAKTKTSAFHFFHTFSSADFFLYVSTGTIGSQTTALSDTSPRFFRQATTSSPLKKASMIVCICSSV